MSEEESTGRERRELLLAEMKSLKEKSIDCSLCPGECCTSRSNSMQIGVSETADIVQYLRSRPSEEQSHWIDRCRDSIRDYRLDVEIPNHGRRANLRRTYTCPFYLGNCNGCALPVTVKPLGCLAFNPITKAATGLLSGCRSNQALLSEQWKNQTTREGAKEPIPLAVVRAWSAAL